MKNTNSFSHKTDLEIIEMYNDNCYWKTKQDIETYFYKKCTPLIKKYSYKYKFLSTVEDNMQESYFLLIQALEWVDTVKITNQDNFSFPLVFKGYLSSHFVKEFKKYSNNANTFTEEYVVSAEVDSPKVEQAFILPQEDSIIFNMYKKQFEETLPEKEKRLFQMLVDGMKKKDIVKELGEKHTANLSYTTKKIACSLTIFFRQIGYELNI
jgi:hypothetical protein